MKSPAPFMIVLLLVFAACSAQTPRENPRDSKYWDDIIKQSRAAPDEPERADERWPEETVEALLARTREEQKKGDLVSAAITVRQAIIKERWNFDANELYQDIQLARDSYESIYNEYLELLGKDLDSGLKLYFFMRPTLLRMKRTTTNFTDVTTSASASTFYGDAVRLSDDARAKGTSPIEAARSALEELFKIAPLHVAGHRLYQDLMLEGWNPDKDGPARIDALLPRYEKLKREYEVNGDAIYLYERVASLRPPLERSLTDRSLRYAKAVSAGFGGYWLFYGFGVFAVERASYKTGVERLALLKLAVLLYSICVSTEELISEGFLGRGGTYNELGLTDQAIADLEMALSLSGNHADALLLRSLGMACMNGGHIDRAADVFARGQKEFPMFFDFPFFLGRVEEARGNKESALAAYEKAYAMLDPASDYAKQLVAIMDALRQQQ